MIRGMTGHAACSFSTDKFDAELEIRSVNSRYFEFKIKCPSRFSSLDIEARKLVSSKLTRGKIDLFLRIVEKDSTTQGSLINANLAKAYFQEAQKLADQLQISGELSIRELLSLPQVLNTETGEVDPDTIKIILSKIEELIDNMMPLMIAEGSTTVNDVLKSLAVMENSVLIISQKFPVCIQKYKQGILDRLKEISNTKAPEERIAIEIELFASRVAINEELVRLENHISVMKEILAQTRKGSSKELDFIGQEMNREANTIASKSSDFEITEHTIILKTEIEKIREHFRNIV